MSATETAGRVMFRYTVPVDDQEWTFDLTSDPVAVANGLTLDEVDFWAEFTAGVPRTPRRFRVFGTGHPLPPGARHVGTCLRSSGLIWHLYELVSDEDSLCPGACGCRLGTDDADRLECGCDEGCCGD